VGNFGRVSKGLGRGWLATGETCSRRAERRVPFLRMAPGGVRETHSSRWSRPRRWQSLQRQASCETPVTPLVGCHRHEATPHTPLAVPRVCHESRTSDASRPVIDGGKGHGVGATRTASFRHARCGVPGLENRAPGIRGMPSLDVPLRARNRIVHRPIAHCVTMIYQLTLTQERRAVVIRRAPS
jgi:hypothetical protein